LNIALLVDEVPSPPRNGVTIPTHQLCEALRTRGIPFEIVLAWSADDQARWPEAEAMLAQHLPGIPVHRVLRHRRGALSSAFDEWTRGRPRFANWRYEPDRVPWSSYDTLVASPISVLDLLLAKAGPGQRKVAYINDVYHSVLATDRYGSGSLRHTFAQLQSTARAGLIARLEKQLLSQVDRIVVQTRRDLAWLRLIGGRSIAQRGRSHHNSVHGTLFDVPAGSLERKQPVAVFSADLKSLLYQRSLAGLLDAWPQVRAQVPDARLHVTGNASALPEWLRNRMASAAGVKSLGFVDQIADVYRPARLAIAPVYKRYGFINKVAESIAAGVPVVADASAFNGMEEILALGGCQLAQTPDEIVRCCVYLLTDDRTWTAASQRCRAYAEEELNAPARVDRLLQAVLE
jgi:glycosyltransferase involved in cell wall biosynthesis